MRCGVCGRPYDGEALKAGEIACQGCHGEYLAFAGETKDGEFVYTVDQALALARQKHEAREAVLMAAVILGRYEKNAAGKHGETGAPLALSGKALVDVKAHAAAMVTRLKRAA